MIKTQINGNFSTEQGARMAIAGIIGGLMYEAQAEPDQALEVLPRPKGSRSAA